MKNKFFSPNKLIMYVCFLILVGIQHIQLNISVITFSQFLGIHKYVHIVDYLSLTILSLLLIFIFSDRRWRVAMFISSACVSAWSLLGVYVLRFHGSPLFISELKNAKTAAAVAGAYEIEIYTNTMQVIVCFLLSVFIIVLSLLIEQYLLSGKKFEPREPIWEKRWHAGVLLVLAVLLFAASFDFCYKHRGLIALFSDNAAETTAVSGYEVMFLQDAYSIVHPIVMPEGYSVERIALASVDHELSSNITVFPDIIFIVNESFSDPLVYADFETDVDYMSDFYGIEGATYGYSISPSVGGGTNNTEYEILTSNSTTLFPMGAPFNYMKMDESKCNVVNYLKELGYNTSAFHCYSANNYNRDVAYVDIGFDDIYLGPEAFSYQNSYGNRLWLDSDNYKDLIDVYNMREDDVPQFMYMLTYQNHGGYSQNDSEYDVVHTRGIEDEEKAAEMDEYLTSVQLSAKAFKELTDYFRSVDRDVVIVMTGDHAGSMYLDAQSYQSMPYEQQQIAERTVPYVVWTNFEPDYVDEGEYACMTDLVPITLKTAGLAITSYYEELLEIREELPVRTTSGAYMDKNGEYGMINDNPEYKEIYSQYLFQEYNGLMNAADFIGELFE